MKKDAAEFTGVKPLLDASLFHESFFGPADLMNSSPGLRLNTLGEGQLFQIVTEQGSVTLQKIGEAAEDGEPSMIRARVIRDEILGAESDEEVSLDGASMGGSTLQLGWVKKFCALNYRLYRKEYISPSFLEKEGLTEDQVQALRDSGFFKADDSGEYYLKPNNLFGANTSSVLQVMLPDAHGDLTSRQFAD